MFFFNLSITYWMLILSIIIIFSLVFHVIVSHLWGRCCIICCVIVSHLLNRSLLSVELQFSINWISISSSVVLQFSIYNIAVSHQLDINLFICSVTVSYLLIHCFSSVTSWFPINGITVFPSVELFLDISRVVVFAYVYACCSLVRF